MFNHRLILNLALVLAVTPIAMSQSTVTVTNTEPAIYPLSRLFSYADKVAVVEVVAGTTEAYDVTVYKGKVVDALKGTTVGETIYFGPFTRTEIRAEYVLFLKDQVEPLHPKGKEAGYGVVRYSRVFDEGYSSMLTSYECVFEDASPNHQCDYAVRICTDYIKLPKSLPTSPADDADTPSGCRWVRRDRLIAEIAALAQPEIQ